MEKKWPQELMGSINLAFHTQAAKYGKRAMLKEKVNGKYQDISWEEAAENVRALSMGLQSLGVKPGDRVALMMKTQANWAISDLAILSAAAVNVPIYPTNKGMQISHIINDSGSEIAIAGSKEIFWEMFNTWNEMPGLKVIVVPDGSKSDTGISSAELSLASPRRIMEMEEVKQAGRAYDQENPGLYEKTWQSVKAEDLASIIYTSGTTGNPKGVMLTHNNFLSNARGGMEKVPATDEYVNLSFLPLSHVLERTCGLYYPIIGGCTIAYAEDISTVPENMLEIRPHFMVSVPRLYERIYARILEMIHSGSNLKKNIFYWAKQVGAENARLYSEGKKPSGLFALKFALADKLVFKKIRDLFGDRFTFCISGGAPLGRELAEFFNGMNIRVLEGYGLTETSPVISFNYYDNIRYGSVGKIIPGGECKIADDGEILYKGPNNCLGYFNNPEATEELFDGEWLRTGDIGYIDEDGFLFITDRKKDIIVTSGGKNVAPQPLENLLASDLYIAQAVLQGDKRNYLVAMIVPDFAPLKQYAEKNNISYTDHADLLSKPEIRDFYAKRVGKIMAKVPRFEQVKRIYLKEDEFTMEAKELTPTLKIRRRFIMEKYKDIFDELYSDSGGFINVEYRNVADEAETSAQSSQSVSG